MGMPMPPMPDPEAQDTFAVGDFTITLTFCLVAFCSMSSILSLSG